MRFRREEPPPHSGELNHALSLVGATTQPQISRPMSSGHHICMEHRLRLKNKGRAHMDANQTDTPGVCLWYRGYAYGTGGYAYGTGGMLMVPGVCLWYRGVCLWYRGVCLWYRGVWRVFVFSDLQSYLSLKRLRKVPKVSVLQEDSSRGWLALDSVDS